MPGEQGTHIQEANIKLSIFYARNNFDGNIFKIGYEFSGIDVADISVGLLENCTGLVNWKTVCQIVEINTHYKDAHLIDLVPPEPW